MLTSNSWLPRTHSARISRASATARAESGPVCSSGREHIRMFKHTHIHAHTLGRELGNPREIPRENSREIPIERTSRENGTVPPPLATRSPRKTTASPGAKPHARSSSTASSTHLSMPWKKTKHGSYRLNRYKGGKVSLPTRAACVRA